MYTTASQPSILSPVMRLLNKMNLSQIGGAFAATAVQRDAKSDTTLSPATICEESWPAHDGCVLRLRQTITHRNYREFYAHAEALYQRGETALTVDLANCESITTAGLFALHSIVACFRGDTSADPESGWSALRWMAETNRSAGTASQVRLINVQPAVAKRLQEEGLVANLGHAIHALAGDYATM